MMGQRPADTPVIVSVFGPTASGKSQITKRVAERFPGGDVSRVRGDWWITPRGHQESWAEFRARPLSYDWALLESQLRQPGGSSFEEPGLDFVPFQRRLPGFPQVATPVMVVDSLQPVPFADWYVRVHAPVELRRARLAARDIEWQRDVSANWDQLEATATEVDVRVDLDLVNDGELDDAVSRLYVWLTRFVV